jgi:xanthine dehydrogenase YagR molybdenum-binding subunit
MKFETVEGPNPIDRMTVIGRPADRIDGPLKTTGQARYAYERHDVVPNQAYGEIVGAAIAKGRITKIDIANAKDAPGVLAIVTAENAGKLETGEFYVARQLAGPQVEHYHQAVAVVVARTFEQARAAARLVRVEYAREKGAFNLAATRDAGTMPKSMPDSNHGDFARAFEAAPVKLDETYTTPDQAHCMMEPHATVAAWQGDRLTLWTSVQIIKWAKRDLPKILGIPAQNIRFVSPFIGGGFGGKATVLSDAVLAAVASRLAGRPVKIALPRALLVNNTTHRPATIQRVRLGAERDGRLIAIGHESWSGNLPGGSPERCTLPTASLYAAPNRMLRARLSVLDLPEGNAMRAPGETPGMMAFEVAMDELAEKLGIDPVELRLRNDTQVDPMKPERRFSTRYLAECLRVGAERFGWNARQAKPAQVRDGRSLIGMGMAAAIRGDNVDSSAARVRLGQEGTVTVECDMTDLGTGSYTVLAQTAAETMGVPLHRVVVRLGDSDLPQATGSLGQRGANSSASGVYAACLKLREQVAQRLGFNTADVDFVEGEVRAGNRHVKLAEAAATGELVAEDKIEFGEGRNRVAHQTFGAHFCEVAVDAATAEVRVRRMVTVCDCGRILNPKTARSQVIGAMTMGIGGALMEELAVDQRGGFFVNHDLASYEVPVHADVPHLDVIFLDTKDPASSPLKAKGVGELGICGAPAAIANAIYNATGVRVRDYPITLDKLIDRLPEVA